MTAFLLRHGADPNARSYFGDTALHVGIRGQLLGGTYDDAWGTGQYAVESLRELITDHTGSEASDINRAIGNAHLLMHHRASHEDILNFLFDIGLDRAATDLDGRTLTHHGAIHGVFTKDLLDFLECRGVLDLHTRDSIGKTPLDYAEEEANREFPEDIFSIHHQRVKESYDCLKAMSHDLP
ncbi:hypothetical protein BDW69DRAFT_184167 [Aspergillus filifer]